MTANITKVGLAVGAAIAAYLAVGAYFAHAAAEGVVTSSIRTNAQENSVITSANIGTSVVDVAKVASSTAASSVPTGTVDFQYYSNTACSGSPAATQSGVSLVNGFATSSAQTSSAGGNAFKVHYNGDGGGTLASDGPCEPLAATSASDSIATTLSTTTPIWQGESVHDSALISNATGNAGGSVTYTVYSNNTCATLWGNAGSQTVTNGTVPDSAPFSFTVPGTYYWQAVYHGDANNSAATSTCGSEVLTVNATPTPTKNSPTVATTLSTTTSVLTGSSIHDSAAFSGATAGAGGDLAYVVYTDASCQTPLAGAGVKTVTNATVPDSDSVVFNNAGTFYWQAVYHSDANNNAATSTCGSEVLTVTTIPSGKNSPTLSTTLSTSSILTGTSVHDSANLTGETANASGSVAYNMYTNNSCTAGAQSAGTKTVTNGSILDSDSLQFNFAGTFYWQAAYSGDANNNPATSTCASEILTVGTAGSGTPPAGPGTISGEVFNDANDNGVMDSGEGGLGGFTVHLYQGTNFNSFTYSPVFKTAITDGSGNYSFTGLADGTYSVEQVLKKGWKQTTDDYTSVAISGGAGQSGLNFGDVVGPKGKERGHGTEKQHHGQGKGNDKDKKCNGDNDENEGCIASSTPSTSTSTKPWWRNVEDNGLHLGWLIGKGNQGKDHGKQGKDD